jgi:hypothetical protein
MLVDVGRHWRVLSDLKCGDVLSRTRMDPPYEIGNRVRVFIFYVTVSPDRMQVFVPTASVWSMVEQKAAPK